MNFSDVLDRYQSDSRIEELIEALNQTPRGKFKLTGLVGSAPAFIAASVFKKTRSHHLFIASDLDEAAYFQNDLKNLLDKKDIYFLPDSFKRSGIPGEVNKNHIMLRVEAITALRDSTTRGELIVTYPEALFEKIAGLDAENEITFTVGQHLDREKLLEELIDLGFDRTDFVYEPGQFSMRGGIIDIYSYGNEHPLRIELFDREVETIRTFDPLDQLSIKKVERATVIPDVQTELSGAAKTSLWDLLPEGTLVWAWDPALIVEKVQQMYDKAIQIAGSDSLDPDLGFPSPDALEDHFDSGPALSERLQDRLVLTRKSFFKDASEHAFETSPQPSFNKNFDLLIDNLNQNTQGGIDNIIFSDSSKQIERFYHIFEDLKADVSFFPVAKAISNGFIDRSLNLACYTDHQIFDRYHKYSIKQGFSRSKAMLVKTLRELVPGDYVTHLDHGIGVFSGMEKMESNGQMQEMVRLVYQGNDLLYVGINSLHKISKFTGKDGAQPKVNKLGSGKWEAVKRKTKKKIKDIARDLIKLYAKRKAQKGFAFSPDSYLQDELEASFIYEDTQDQLKATQSIKKDMEADHPMDKLVCGDVGFGKTEVAIRAAFKAVADSKQVAVLVPTTILALQHYKTFSARLAEFPCTVDYLNRFKTAKEKKETLRKVKEGEVDIVIGTHMLLSKDMDFKDLGLLIIDEEQKFGVAAKEKLRDIKVNVDTLTLTATPIPRTLQFSLMGARDLAIIQTAPPNRQPIHTEMHAFDDDLIRDAIYYEVNRGGQVFFIHNRVKDIDDMTELILRLCPDLKVITAHGQMDGPVLEKVMQEFIQGEHDILVSTNIVESGLDIPNANTMIINNAQNFGLSDLHQLRGRVGRSNKKAFCYLFTPPPSVLTQEARKRLQTIEDYAELGSGFNIAMRDLDIRGAGNMLGGEQSGFIAEIGFDMYQKILDEAIHELKESDFKELFADQQEEQELVYDCQVDTDVEMLIPDDYVSNIQERLRLYTDLSNATNEEEIEIFRESLIDRFGPIPSQVQEIFNALRIKWVGKRVGFERIDLRGSVLRCYFIADKDSAYYASPAFGKMIRIIQESNRYSLKETAKNLILVIQDVNGLVTAREVLESIENKLAEKVLS
jgi:transcription-repair coupling factor (superfamily II helicase)